MADASTGPAVQPSLALRICCAMACDGRPATHYDIASDVGGQRFVLMRCEYHRGAKSKPLPDDEGHHDG